MVGRNTLRWAGIIGVAVTFVGIGLRLSTRNTTVLAKASGAEIRLADLTGEQERAVLTYRSQGCFHSTMFQLEYAPTPTPHLTVTEQESERSTPKQVGTVSLTTEQVKRLDNTLRFFRKHDHDGGCTTRDTLGLTAYRNGEKIATESHEDATCSRDVLEEADLQDQKAVTQYPEWKRLRSDIAPILSLKYVIVLAKEAQQKGLATTTYPSVPRNYTKAYNILRGKKRELTSKQQAEQMVRDLPGYATVHRQFRVVGVDKGIVNMFPDSLNGMLLSTAPRPVDSSWWFDPIQNGKPRYDWNELLQVHQSVEKAVAPHLWIRQWKKAGPGRRVESQIFGRETITEMEPQVFVYPPWKHAGLHGLPRYQVQLRRNDSTWITVYFGDKDARALIADADPPRNAKSRFWLDTVTLSYHPTQTVPEYIIVTPDGIWKRNHETRKL